MHPGNTGIAKEKQIRLDSKDVSYKFPTLESCSSIEYSESMDKARVLWYCKEAQESRTTTDKLKRNSDPCRKVARPVSMRKSNLKPINSNVREISGLGYQVPMSYS